MTTTLRQAVALAAVALLTWPATAAAQAFSSGSNGSFGPITAPNAVVTTLEVPPDGVFHATTVDIVGGGTLRFIPNAQNTPITILAQGDVVIAGLVEVNGQSTNNATPGAGGPGGFPGGSAGDTFMGTPAGDGHGPGGGSAGTACCTDTTFGRGMFGCDVPSRRPTDGQSYGNSLLLSLVGGSGGGGSTVGTAGGGGGGALLVASTTRITMTGEVSAEGGFSSAGAGSGGAVRFVAPIVSGSGIIDVRGGNSSSGAVTFGSHGRSRVDALDRSTANFNIFAPCAHSAGAVMLLAAPGIGTLRAIQVAGTPIPENTTSAVTIQLQPGTSPDQNVTVRARGYTGSVPIEVALTPDRGSRTTFPATINVTGDPTDLVVPVTFPINIPTRVDVWTR